MNHTSPEEYEQQQLPDTSPSSFKTGTASDSLLFNTHKDNDNDDSCDITTEKHNNNNNNNINNARKYKDDEEYLADNNHEMKFHNSSASSATNNNSNGSRTTTPTMIRAHYLSAHLRQVGAIPVKIEASSETLKEELPHNSWMPDFQYVVEGKQVGYAVRETGDDLIYVKFPIVRDLHNQLSASPPPPLTTTSTSAAISTTTTMTTSSPNNVTTTNSNATASNYPSHQHHHLLPPASIQLIGFTLPRRFLVPVSLPQDGSVPSAANSPTYRPPAATTTTTTFSIPNNINSNNNNFATSNSGKDNGQDAIISKMLSESLERKSTKDGKPLLCVVCGAYNTEGGQVRRSGFKCKNCIGQKSVARLKDAYLKLMQTNEPED